MLSLANNSKTRLAYIGLIISYTIIGLVLPATTYADVITNPTHIVDAQWNFTGSSYTDTSVDMTPLADGTPDGYFYADEFYFPNNVDGGNGTAATGYMGLQDEGNEGTSQTVPKNAGWTIYGGTSEVAASDGSTGSCGNPSGEGQSCWINYTFNWVVGQTYRFDMSLTNANDGNGNEVWSGQFTDLSTNTNVQLGTIDAPVAFGMLSPVVITFHERFSGPTTACNQITPSFVTFANADMQKESETGSAWIPAGYEFTSPDCPGFVNNSIVNNIVRSSYGFIPGDLNGDKVVNSSDVNLVINNWGSSNALYDPHNDGSVDIFDLSEVLSNYGNTVP
jgi:hypothetical protein